MNSFTFKVHGRGEFPIDMLRYDACWPASERDSAIISQHRDKRTVELRTAQSPGRRPGKSHLTPERWASFGWRILADNAVTEGE